MYLRFSPICLAAAISVAPAFAQEIYKNEVSGQFFGAFVNSTWAGGEQQTATDTGGVLASYRFFFNDFNGVELNYGWAPGTQKYFDFFNGPYGVRSDSNEATAAWVFRYPGHRVIPFGLVGAGALVFNPINPVGFETTQARGAFLYGGGVDISLTDRFFIRAEYRGLVYNTPDFNTLYLGPYRATNRAEPTVGFGVRF
jgi:outer membrane immunogenic protein